MQATLLGFIEVVYRPCIYTGIQTDLLNIYLAYLCTKLHEHRTESYLESALLCLPFIVGFSLKKMENSRLNYISCWPLLQMFCMLSVILIFRACSNWMELQITSHLEVTHLLSNRNYWYTINICGANCWAVCQKM